jgi:hypothetical protein
MRVLIVASLITVGFGLALVGKEAAYARTRTPTPTPTPTPVPVSTATPVPPERALFQVRPWVDAQNQAREVTARIGETVCATGDNAMVPPGTSGLFFSLFVPSEEVLPGCGREGAVVTFFVDGRQAPQTAIWHSGIMYHVIDAIVGHPFAHFVVFFDGRVVPYIGDKPCGNSEVVYSNEQEPGCGVEGSQITFKLLDAQGNVIAVANETATWHAWDGISEPQTLRLTFGPAGGITMPGTGMGGGPAQAAAPWGPLALALASLGLAGGIAALAVRRRAMTR